MKKCCRLFLLLLQSRFRYNINSFNLRKKVKIETKFWKKKWSWLIRSFAKYISFPFLLIFLLNKTFFCIFTHEILMITHIFRIFVICRGWKTRERAARFMEWKLISARKRKVGEEKEGGGRKRNSFLRRANEWHRFSTGRGNSLVLFLSATQLFELNAVFKRNVLSCCREKTVSTPAWPQIKNLFQRRAAPVSRAWIEFWAAAARCKEIIILKIVSSGISKRVTSMFVWNF